jgi:hypothetical protein
MKRLLVSMSLAGMIGLATIPEAAAWTRSGSVTTWRGTYHAQASGGCSGGTCSRSRSVTGPYGGTISRTGSITRTGPGSFTYTRTTTGPYGNGVTRTGSVDRF